MNCVDVIVKDLSPSLSLSVSLPTFEKGVRDFHGKYKGEGKFWSQKPPLIQSFILFFFFIPHFLVLSLSLSQSLSVFFLVKLFILYPLHSSSFSWYSFLMWPKSWKFSMPVWVKESSSYSVILNQLLLLFPIRASLFLTFHFLPFTLEHFVWFLPSIPKTTLLSFYLACRIYF